MRCKYTTVFAARLFSPLYRYKGRWYIDLQIADIPDTYMHFSHMCSRLEEGFMMMEKLTETTCALMKERFGKDSLLSLATCVDGIPYVRTVNGYYEEGMFYIITYGLSDKMEQIRKNPVVAIAGEWFTSHGI